MEGDDIYEETAELLKEENKRLTLENKRLARQLSMEKTLNERNKIRAEVNDNLGRVIAAEKSKLEVFMSLILANLSDIIFIFDQSERLTFASDSYLERSGIAGLGIVRGKTLIELLDGAAAEQRETINELFYEALRTKTLIRTEGDLDFAGGGGARHYIIQLTPMIDEDDTGVGSFVLFYDTTEITLAKDEAERARDLAEQSTQAKTDFLANMSHEIRTPMNAIIGMTTIAKGSEEIERKDYCLGKIAEASTHLLGVINDILDMSKIEANKFELSLAEFSFERLFQKVVSVSAFRIGEKKLELSVKLDGSVPPLLIGDDQRISQVITNLLSNSVKFTPDGGNIILEGAFIGEEDGVCEIQVSVTDSGIGISPEQQARLFSPFMQADSSTSRKFGGTGLGLSISKRIVEMMGGRIWVESEQGRGSTFSFTLKAERARSACPEPSEDAPSQTPAPEDESFEGFKLLLVEDVEINREIVLAILEPTLLEIDCAENGKQAVEKFSRNPDKYDMIFMDLQMPEMDGYDATRAIRAMDVPRASKIPIVAMTANVFQEDVGRCLAAGMNDHLGKPLDFNGVLEKLRTYLKKERI